MAIQPTAAVRPEKRGAAEPIAALNRIRIKEQDVRWTEREPLVDIRTACPGVHIQDHVCPYLRRRVAEMLRMAQAALPSHKKLSVGSAIRTLSMQRFGWDSYFASLLKEHPNWPLSAMRRATNRFFAPYDQKAPPGHCTGGAVDVGLLGADDEPMDLSSPLKGWEAAYTWTERLSAEAKANRMLMVDAMLQAGFSNCREEFWHYSYGDSAWAVRTGEHECPYGWAYPPVELDKASEGVAATLSASDTIRDDTGRPISATGTLTCAAMVTDWSIRVSWAMGIPVCLRLAAPPAALEQPVTVSDGGEGREPIALDRKDSDRLMLRFKPTADRVTVANYPQASPS